MQAISKLLLPCCSCQTSDRFWPCRKDVVADIGWVQTQLINLLQGDVGCITVVGDDAQSIYAFRGALASHAVACSGYQFRWQAAGLAPAMAATRAANAVGAAVSVHASRSLLCQPSVDHAGLKLLSAGAYAGALKDFTIAYGHAEVQTSLSLNYRCGVCHRSRSIDLPSLTCLCQPCLAQPRLDLYTALMLEM